ncbi:MAG: TlpA disulfide reductase family protein [Salinisphaeraceae bacterium]
MQTIALGPLSIPLDRLLLMLGFAGALVAGNLLSSSRQSPSANDRLWLLLIAGVIGARAGFVARHWSLYASRPLEILYIWDGGFWWPGAATVVIALVAVYLIREPGNRRALASALLAGGLIWLGGTGLMAWLTPRAAMLPPVEMQQLNGSAVVLTDIAPGPRVINLWATWCGPCRREMPVLEAAANRHHDIAFVFANQRESAATVQAYLEAQSLDLDNVVLDASGRLGQALGSGMLPTTLFVDRAGRIIDWHLGELTTVTLAAGVEQLHRTATPEREMPAN